MNNGSLTAADPTRIKETIRPVSRVLGAIVVKNTPPPPERFRRPGCAFVLGGLDDDENAKEVRLFRAFGEDDLRWLAKACLEAAYKLRRIENARRKRATKPAPASEERGG